MVNEPSHQFSISDQTKTQAPTNQWVSMEKVWLFSVALLSNASPFDGTSQFIRALSWKLFSTFSQYKHSLGNIANIQTIF